MLLQKTYSILRLLDEMLLVRLLSFDSYFSFHQALGFPLRKMAFLLQQGYKINLNDPKTFNEKVVYRQLFERDPLLPMIVDKYAVREYVKEKIGEKHLIPLLQIANSFDEIDFSKLPSEYVMKMTHASGENIIFKEGKNHLGYDNQDLKKTFDIWFKEKYRYQSLIWFVQPIKRKIMVESLLKDDNGKIPKDYKLFVFNGRVEFILVIHDRFEEYTENLYNRDWTVADFTFKDPVGVVEEKPEILEELIDATERLASDFTAMRVDFYVIGTKIFFGELTPAHANAGDIFIPVEYDKYYGEKWKDHTSLMRKS